MITRQKNPIFFHIFGTIVPSGSYIGYDGNSLIDVGVVDTVDIDYIKKNLDYIEIFGNIFNEDANAIAEKASQWLVDRGAIPLSSKKEISEEIMQEIQKTKNRKKTLEMLK